MVKSCSLYSGKIPMDSWDLTLSWEYTQVQTIFFKLKCGNSLWTREVLREALSDTTSIQDTSLG